MYGYWRSSSTWRTRIALHLKGIPFKYEPVNLLKSETQTEDYAKKNPQKKVPLLYIDENKNIAQSLAIIDYLEQAHPETPSLLPKDPCQGEKRQKETYSSSIRERASAHCSLYAFFAAFVFVRSSCEGLISC